MSQATTVEMLVEVGDVPDSYRHHARQLTPGPPHYLAGNRGRAVLKWYLLAREDDPVPAACLDEARDRVAMEFARGTLLVPYGMGFVVLHHSTPLDYLIVGAWRAHQELWETLYVRDARDGSAFQRMRPGENAPTLCVWELAPVWHEREAWVRYLESPRDLAARRAWLDDVLHGQV
ncbi:MAG: hypothetical protein H0W06_03695 [Chloroflexia bacterium]|nr:hypothetical protein [Chloroflexia bacterium]